MARHNRECALCGKSYKYCSSCSQDRMKPSWMAEPYVQQDLVNIFAEDPKLVVKPVAKPKTYGVVTESNE